MRCYEGPVRKLGCFTVALTLGAGALACGGSGASPGAASSSAASISGDPTRSQITSAIKDYTAIAGKGQWDREWDLLVPAQQTAIPKDKFLACHSGRAGAGDVRDVRVIDTANEQSTPPGMSSPAASVVVTFDATVNGTRSTSIVHLFVVDGQLRISLDESTFKRCSTS